MKYKYFFFATLIGTVVSAVVGIVMAYMGFGVWALVAQYLTNSVVDTLVIWFTCGWHPSFKFDIGETVFYVRAEYNSEKKAHCPRCNGKGYIELDAEKNNLPQDVTEPVKYLCPE